MTSMQGYVFFFGLMVVVCAGCATVSNPVRASFGTSYEFAKTSQTLNPSASDNLNPVEGLDGGGAQKTIEKYQNSFEENQPEPQFVLRAGNISR